MFSRHIPASAGQHFLNPSRSFHFSLPRLLTFVGHLRSISAMISSAHRIASEIAQIAAGTRAPPSNCASRRAARMLAAMSKTRFLPSSMEFGIRRPAGQPHADSVMNQSGQHRSSRHLVVGLQSGSLSCSLFVRHREMHWRKGQRGALAGCDRRPEWTAGWCKRLCADCGTVGGATTITAGK